jgi:hypothetical protein
MSGFNALDDHKVGKALAHLYNVRSVPIVQLEPSVCQGGKTVNRCSGYLRQLSGTNSSYACSFQNVSRHEDRALLL